MDNNKLFSLENKNILLTGATGHLGTNIAWALAQSGANVLINSKTKKKCIELVEKIKKKNLKAELAYFDIANNKKILNYVNSISNLAIDCLVNNAYAGKSGTIKSSNSNNYLESYNVGLIGVHNLTSKLLKNLRLAVKNSGDASVINIASMYGLVAPDLRIYDNPKKSNSPFYGATKAALIQWTRYAASEFGKEKIRFNSISPGAFPSSLSQKKSPNLIKKLNYKIPLGRIGEPIEVVGSVILLASKAGSYINGSNICIDGGYTSL